MRLIETDEAAEALEKGARALDKARDGSHAKVRRALDVYAHHMRSLLWAEEHQLVNASNTLVG